MDWFDWAHALDAKQLWLTMGWLRALPLHTEVDLCMLDRNTCDLVCDSERNTPGVPYTPSVFFKTNRVSFVKTSAYAGKFVHHSCGVIWEAREFEMDWKYSTPDYEHARLADGFGWYFAPRHPDTNPDTIPDATCIGWRGPALPWDVIDTLPQVKWFEPEHPHH